MNIKMVLIVKQIDRMFQFTFKGEPEHIRSWLSEVRGEIMYIEIRMLYNTTAVMTYGVQHHGEIHKFERNSLALETEYLNYE